MRQTTLEAHDTHITVTEHTESPKIEGEALTVNY